MEQDEKGGEGEALDGGYSDDEGYQASVHYALFFERQYVHIEGYLEGFLA